MIRRLAIGWIAGLVVLFTMAYLNEADFNDMEVLQNAK